MLEVGSLAVVSQPFHEFTVDEGYLVLRTGAQVCVEYVGQGDEAGWCFGYEPGSTVHGWFPEWAVHRPRVPEPPRRPPPPSAPEPEPLLPERPQRPPPPAASVAEPAPVDLLGGYNIASAECLPQTQLPPPGFCEDGVYGRHAPAPSHSLWEAVNQGIDAGRTLPMASRIEALMQLVADHRVVIVDAATGSGKSTLVPLCLASQCLEAGRACRIVVTQPRRLAAKGLATRVADQTGTGVGEVVGYRVGGSDRMDDRALVVYVTVGHLLQALVHNPSHLDCYSHIVLDEVHERFVEADFLMALLRLSLSRPETIRQRVVIMSATLQQTLGRFFKPALLPAPAETEVGTISLPGRTPFEVRDYAWEDVQNTWPMLMDRFTHKDPFTPALPSNPNIRDDRKRSDVLTKLCKDLAPCCAKLICELHFQHDSNVVLVFLPGLDQMKEVQTKLEEEVERCAQGHSPLVFLMHSALEEETYRDALKATEPDVWKVVLATNIAESSLTVPGVSAVIDFGLHRVNVYSDERKMSVLITTWCSHASLKQRRGRTGRTNPGRYIAFLSRQLLSELSDFDASGVERAPLTRVALEAAHLADLLSSPAMVRTGLPVTMTIAENTRTGIVQYWDCHQSGWVVTGGGGAEKVLMTLPESELRPVWLSVRDVLGMLPTPPREDRSRSAIIDLQELGLMTLAGERPTVLGVACLKLPVDPPLARLVVLGSFIGCGADALVLAAALSLFPSCDVFRTPWNPKSSLDSNELNTLRKIIAQRQKLDDNTLSEPLTIHKICKQWLENGGGLGKNLQPKGSFQWAKERGVKEKEQMLHMRLWTQFTDKVVELAKALLRISTESSDQAQDLNQFLRVARGAGQRGSGHDLLQKVDDRQLLALITWSLAPLGFVAVGQTPSLYGNDGVYSGLKRVANQHGGHISSTLFWPEMEEANARQVAQLGQCTVPRLERSDTGEKKNTYISFSSPGVKSNEPNDRVQMSNDAQLLYRICGPFNNKEIMVIGLGANHQVKQPPLHPCTLNWYMPFRDGQGLQEVFVGWKAQAETLLHIPKPGDRSASCRPKEFLVAAGGEWHRSGKGGSGNRMKVMLRGVSLLPCGDGGRGGLLWLLAAGMPRESKMVALVAPGKDLAPGSFEVRALRLWQRTLCLRKTCPITCQDLLAVNTFRRALLELQERKPHRLAGPWRGPEGQKYHIECLEDAALEASCGSRLHGSSDRMEQLLFSLVPDPPKDASSSVLLTGIAGRNEWSRQDATKGDSSGDALVCREEPDGRLLWSNGSVWFRPNGHLVDEMPTLEMLSQAMLDAIKSAADKLLDITTEGNSVSSTASRSNWPARLVPLQPLDKNCSSSLAPFDLDKVEEQMRRFSSKLKASDECSDNFDDDEALTGSDDDNDDDDDDDGDEEVVMDTSQEAVNEDYMWRLAENDDFEPRDAKYLALVESTLALPMSTTCAECEKEGKSFSKRQLARPWEHRVCEDCIREKQVQVYKPADGVGPTLPDSAVGGPGGCQVALCSVCKVQLTKQNCTPSQKSKAPSRRKCISCVAIAANAA